MKSFPQLYRDYDRPIYGSLLNRPVYNGMSLVSFDHCSPVSSTTVDVKMWIARRVLQTNVHHVLPDLMHQTWVWWMPGGQKISFLKTKRAPHFFSRVVWLMNFLGKCNFHKFHFDCNGMFEWKMVWYLRESLSWNKSMRRWFPTPKINTRISGDFMEFLPRTPYILVNDSWAKVDKYRSNVRTLRSPKSVLRNHHQVLRGHLPERLIYFLQNLLFSIRPRRKKTNPTGAVGWFLVGCSSKFSSIFIKIQDEQIGATQSWGFLSGAFFNFFWGGEFGKGNLEGSSPSHLRIYGWFIIHQTFFFTDRAPILSVWANYSDQTAHRSPIKR